MLIELKTKRRWILSILEAVDDRTEGRVIARATVKQTTARRLQAGQMSLAAHLKAATRPLAGSGR